MPSLISDIVSIAYRPASARIVAGRRSVRRRAANPAVANRYGTTCGWPGSSRWPSATHAGYARRGSRRSRRRARRAPVRARGRRGSTRLAPGRGELRRARTSPRSGSSSPGQPDTEPVPAVRRVPAMARRPDHRHPRSSPRRPSSIRAAWACRTTRSRAPRARAILGLTFGDARRPGRTTRSPTCPACASATSLLGGRSGRCRPHRRDGDPPRRPVAACTTTRWRPVSPCSTASAS